MKLKPFRIRRSFNNTMIMTPQLPPDSLLSRTTVPIVLKLKRTFHSIGTGILISRPPHRFLVTAAHVIQRSLKYHGKIGMIGGDGRFSPIEGRCVCSGHKKYGTLDDPIDVAAFRLYSPTALVLQEKVFLGKDFMDLSTESYEAFYCLFGYAVSHSERNRDGKPRFSSRPLAVPALEFSGCVRLISDYIKQLHLLLQVRHWHKDHELWKGEKPEDVRSWSQRFGSCFPGLSGSGVWKITRRSPSCNQWVQTEGRIAGLQTGIYNNHRLIKATRWSAVMAFLEESFPEIEADGSKRND